jgi:hypothetical protein
MNTQDLRDMQIERYVSLTQFSDDYPHIKEIKREMREIISNLKMSHSEIIEARNQRLRRLGYPIPKNTLLKQLRSLGKLTLTKGKGVNTYSINTERFSLQLHTFKKH